MANFRKNDSGRAGPDQDAGSDRNQSSGTGPEGAPPFQEESAAKLPGAQHSLARRYSFKLIANIAGVPLFLLMEAILPRALGPAGYGAFSYATGMFQYLTNFLDFGTSTCLFTTLSKRQQEWPLLAFFMRIAGLLFVLCLLMAGLCMIPELGLRIMPGVPAWIMAPAALWAFATWGGRVLRGVNDALGQTVKSEKIRTVAGVLACAALLLLHLGGVLSMPVLFIHQLVYLFGMMLAFKIIVLEAFRPGRENGSGRGLARRPSLKLSLEQKRAYADEFAKYSFPLFLQLIVVTLALMADRWLLQVFEGNVEQGYFSISQKVGMGCFLFISAMTPLLTRELAVAHGKNDHAEMGRLFTRFAPMLYAVAVYFSAFVCLEAQAVVNIFGGSQFAAAVLTVQIMALYPIHQGYGQLAQAVYYASSRTGALSRISIVSSAAGFLISLFLLMPEKYGGQALGSVGLAFKMVGLQVLVCNFLLFMCSRFIPIRLGRLISHQLFCLAAFLGLAWASGQLAYFWPGYFGSSPFGLEGLVGEVAGLCLRGAAYTAGVGALCLVCPWLMGMGRSELKALWLRAKGADKK